MDGVNVMKMQIGVPEWDFITAIIHLQSVGCGVCCQRVKGRAEIYQVSKCEKTLLLMWIRLVEMLSFVERLVVFRTTTVL